MRSYRSIDRPTQSGTREEIERQFFPRVAVDDKRKLLRESLIAVCNRLVGVWDEGEGSWIIPFNKPVDRWTDEEVLACHALKVIREEKAENGDLESYPRPPIDPLLQALEGESLEKYLKLEAEAQQLYREMGDHDAEVARVDSMLSSLADNDSEPGNRPGRSKQSSKIKMERQSLEAKLNDLYDLDEELEYRLLRVNVGYQKLNPALEGCFQFLLGILQDWEKNNPTKAIPWRAVEILNFSTEQFMELEELEKATPKFERQSINWVGARKKNLDVLGFDTTVLANYRLKSFGGRQLDAYFGVDRDGRRWRRDPHKTAGSTVHYYRNDLEKYSSKVSN